ncbi:hypothetical protein [Bacteroides fragilis]|uniref:hypothetical protein n=1 Tax=Bacteroides fragilis TaxID=817 RepID=UPI00031FEA21
MDILKGHGFSVFDNATYIGGICAEGAAGYTRKQLDALTEFVKSHKSVQKVWSMPVSKLTVL